MSSFLIRNSVKQPHKERCGDSVAVTRTQLKVCASNDTIAPFVALWLAGSSTVLGVL